MSLPYQAISVAIYFLKLGKKEQKSISHMKLQKLVYFAHGWCLAIKGQSLIQESIEAWKFGPVIDSVYQKFRSFGSAPVEIDSIPFDCDLDELEKDASTIELIEKVWDVFKDYTAFELSKMTHLPGTPWMVAREGDIRSRYHVAIKNQLIRDYFIRQSQHSTRISA